DTKGKGGRDEQKPEDQKPVRITGRAVLINSVQLTVDGQVIEITRDTVIDGTLVMGLRVEVEGIEQPDGRVVASLIKVLKPVQTPTPVPTTTPTPVPTPQDDSTPSTITVEGLLTRIEGARWQVGGHVVIITPQTSIVGIPVVGVLLEVEGVQRGDGAILAVTVSIE
ncbi:MAG: hypothetical protein HYX82_02800, partial [Chloroflexi bacterium]|nr:hypothetical protein [Chloroflexota bacterium]